MNAVEYQGSDGSRLFVQYELAEGQEFIDETFQYRIGNADRIVGVRLLHEYNGVKSILRLCPQGTTIVEQRQEDWREPVVQFLTVSSPQPIVLNSTERP